MTSSERSSSRSSFAAPAARNNSPMRSHGSTPSGTPSNSRPGSSSSSQASTSPESDRVDTLENVRVVLQDQSDPYELVYAPPTSRYFRLAAFAMHVGLSMLESNGAGALIATGEKLWDGVQQRGRRNWAFQGDLRKDPASIKHYTISFLKKLRASSPSITISDRVTGDGVTRRLDWGSNADVYNAKFAALFLINKAHFDNVLIAAERNDTENLEKGLFILALTAAHELVHVYFGILSADEHRVTPAPVNYPQGLSVGHMAGESGRYWESEFFGAIIKSYYQPSDPLGMAQAGRLFLCERDDRGYELSQTWVRACLRKSFVKPTITNNGLKLNAGKPFAITKAMQTMQKTRPPHPNSKNIAEDLYALLGRINRLPSHRVDRVNLESILSVVTNPRKLMAAEKPTS